MAGVLNFTSPPSFRPPHLSRRLTISTMGRISVRVSAEVSDTPSSSSTSVKGEPPKLGLESISPPSNFKAPKPKRFTPRPDKIVDILGASLALFFRFGAGVFVSGYSASFVSKNEIPTGQYALEFAGVTVKETSKLGPRPEKPIEIYEFESCPFCRKVREIVAVLDLDVLYYPCPRNGPNFRPKAAQMGGKKQFPYMVDPNTGVAMYESDDIIRYLFQKYGDGNVPFQLSLGLLTTLTAGFAMIARMGKGSIYTRSKLPPKPLELWAYEPSPFCKVVREVLVELELPHILHREIKPRAFYVISPMEETVRSIFDAIFIMGHLKTVSLCFKAQSCARGSPKRQLLFEKLGHFQVPYLEDPNTGIGMFESAEIEEYLRATYAL